MKSSESIHSQTQNVRAHAWEYVREDSTRHVHGTLTPAKNTRKSDIRKPKFETEDVSHDHCRVFIAGILLMFLVLGVIRWQLAFDHADLTGYSETADAVPQINHPATEGEAGGALNLGQERNRNQAVNLSAYPSLTSAVEVHPETSLPLDPAVMVAANNYPETMRFPDLQQVAYVIAGKTRLPEYIWAPASMDRSQMVNHGMKLSILETTGKRMANDEATVEDRQAHFETKIELIEKKIGLIQEENEQLTGEIDNSNFETYQDQIEFNKNMITQLETEVRSSREVLKGLR